MSDTKEKKHGRAALSATLALLTAASVTVGGMFDSPDAILDPDEPNAIVMQAVNDDGGDDAEPGEENTEKTRRRAGVGVSVRTWILQLPLAVRLLVVVPMWALGSAVLWAAGTLWAAVGTPLLSEALRILSLFAVLLAAYCVTAKLIFPDAPLRKILNRRSILGLLIGSLLLGTADAALPLVWEEYEQIRRIVELLGSLLLLSGVTARFSVREQKERKEAQEAAEKAAKQREEEARKPQFIEFIDDGRPIRIDLRKMEKG